MMIRLFLFTYLVARVVAQDCVSANGTYTVLVDLFAGELGYFQFEECGDMVNPTIGMELGTTYTFVQSDRSNYYHPMGFSYFPDGAHADKDELEPAVSQGSSGCDLQSKCPAPMYFVGGEYAGQYSNSLDVANITSGEEDFGLDAYEPVFFHPIADWAAGSPYSIKLRFDDQTYGGDIFYFCHIHRFMTGRIKLLSSGEPVNAQNTPELGYTYDAPSGFDAQCGTTGLSKYQLPNEECPDRFVCNINELEGTRAEFASCIEAMNCHMFAGMTTNYKAAQSEAALFIWHMRPHHQNAVNMAKALLKTGTVVCNDITAETPDCSMERILRDMVNTQNLQIQIMNNYLDSMELPFDDSCDLRIARENLESSDAQRCEPFSWK